MKAILVMNMPNSCAQCRCYDDMFGTCMIKFKDYNTIEAKETKPTWCPLKPLPEEDDKEYFLEWSRGYQGGWNDCIKAITGDKND